jgi:streptomycin 6-kinase
MHFWSGNGAVQDTAAQQRMIHHEIHESRTAVSSYSRKTEDHWETGSCAGARTHSPSMQSFLSCVSWFSWFTSPTVDWAKAKLPWSRQEHLARQAATLALSTANASICWRKIK